MASAGGFLISKTRALAIAVSGQLGSTVSGGEHAPGEVWVMAGRDEGGEGCRLAACWGANKLSIAATLGLKGE